MMSRWPSFPERALTPADSIVITEKGFDNLTSAPKGEEMLKIINSGY